MVFNVLTIFPEIITSYCGESILGRAQKKDLISVRAVNIRDFAENKHNTVDDSPYGGGAGMVMKPDPIYRALQSINAIPFRKANGLSKVKKIFSGEIQKKKRTILLSPRGRQFDQRLAEEWSRLHELVFVCGRYEGVDQRVMDHMVDEEISIGPYVLAGGELGALVMIEAIARLIPGVLGNPESLREETYGGRRTTDDGRQRSDKTVDRGPLTVDPQKEYPQYTKPADFRGWKVPDVLLSGDHKKIAEWRQRESK